MALWVTAAAFLATQAAGVVAVTPTPELPPFTLFTTESGTEFGLTLPRVSGTGPPPRLAIALASTINETLGRVVQSGCPSVFYFANACPWLVAQGWCASPRSRCGRPDISGFSHRPSCPRPVSDPRSRHVRLPIQPVWIRAETDCCGWCAQRACASLDLPSHGKQILPGEPLGGIIGWRWRTDRGIDFVEQSQRRLEDMVSYLAKHNLATVDGVFIAGISRGGFLAAQYAARAPPARISAVGLLSPVTNLSLLEEFAEENVTMQVGDACCPVVAERVVFDPAVAEAEYTCRGFAPGSIAPSGCRQAGSILGAKEPLRDHW